MSVFVCVFERNSHFRKKSIVYRKRRLRVKPSAWLSLVWEMRAAPNGSMRQQATVSIEDSRGHGPQLAGRREHDSPGDTTTEWRSVEGSGAGGSTRGGVGVAPTSARRTVTSGLFL